MSPTPEQVAANLIAGLASNEIADLDTASNHRYDCRCGACLKWWAQVGPDGGDPGDYGPFTREQVNSKQRELGLEVTS